MANNFILRRSLKILLRLIIIFAFFPNSQAFCQESKISNSSEEYFDEFSDFSDFGEFSNNKENDQNKDPLEKYNRKIYVFNDAFDKYFFKHVAKTYRIIIPKKARNSIRNFLQNIFKPVSILNSVAQGKFENALATFSSLLINTTIGVGGIFDISKSKGIEYNEEDFGQTLGHYNIGSGIYLMVPFLGPSSIRDLSGKIFDSTINPVGFNLLEIGGEDNSLVNSEYRLGIAGLSAIDSRESLLDILDDIQKESFDSYVTIRSAYLQRRISEIKK